VALVVSAAQASHLLSTAFSDSRSAADGQARSAVGRAVFRSQLAANLLVLHCLWPQGHHRTLLCTAAKGVAAVSDAGNGARSTSRQRRSGVSCAEVAADNEPAANHASSTEPPAMHMSGQVVGVVCVTAQRAASDVAEAVGCAVGTPMALVRNLAVAPTWRHKGMARALMRACAAAASAGLRPTPQLLVLHVHRTNLAALRWVPGASGAADQHCALQPTAGKVSSSNGGRVVFIACECLGNGIVEILRVA
jgi:hypothetical protein